MAKSQSEKSSATHAGNRDRASTPNAEAHGMTAAELLSFLREAGGIRTWMETNLANALNVGLSQAREAIAVLQLQGYIEPVGNTSKWRVSDEGDFVSRTKPPRFTPKSVHDTVARFRDRIKAVTEDPDSAYKIVDAVAFGDFLGDAARVRCAQKRKFRL
jgi:hypothetical protein